MGSVISAENARDTIEMGEILFGGAEALQTRAGLDLADQLQLAAALGRPDAQRDARVQPRRTRRSSCTPFLLMGAMSPVSIPATLVQQMAEALSGIALTPARAARAARSCSARSSRTPTCSRARRASARRSRRSACSAPARSRATSACRSGAAAGSPSSQTPDAQARLRGADDDAADVPRRHELRDALGRLARGRARVELREVHRRHRDPADAASTSSQPLEIDEDIARVRRPRGGRLRRALPRRGAHAGALPRPASTGRCCPRPRTSTAGRSNGGAGRRRARRRGSRRDARRLRAAADRRRGARPAARLRGPPPHRARRDEPDSLPSF